MDSKEQKDDAPDDDKKPGGKPQLPLLRRNNPNMWWVGVILLGTLLMVVLNQGPQRSQIREDFFLEQLKSGNVSKVTYVGEHKVIGTFKTRPEAPEEYDADGKLSQPTSKGGQPIKLQQRFSVELDRQMSEFRRKQLEDWYSEYDVHTEHQPAEERYGLLVATATIVLPLVLLFFLWNMFRRTRDQMMGGGFLSGFSKSTAKRYEEGEQPITFDDVAGLEGVKADLQEFVEFLRDPEKFQRLGGRVPKGVLLNGPPGHGQDAAGARRGGRSRRAVLLGQRLRVHSDVCRRRCQPRAGSVSRRPRKMRPPSSSSTKSMPSDGSAEPGLGGGHDEREQTLNQILSEMDGFYAERLGDCAGRDQPTRCARSGSAAPRPLRSPRHGRSTDAQGPRGDL